MHIGNGGVTIGVSSDDEFGPVLTISSCHFGNNTTKQKIYIDREALQGLANLFVEASGWDFSEPYCYAAHLVGEGNGPDGCEVEEVCEESDRSQ